MLGDVFVGGTDIDAVGAVKGGEGVADAGDFHAVLVGETEGGDGADIAEALDDGGAVVGLHLEDVHRALDEIDDAAPGRFAPAGGAADAHRLAGDDLGDSVALVDGIGVHEPRHDLLVCAHVGANDIGMRAHEGNHLLHVAAGRGPRARAGKGRAD